MSAIVIPDQCAGVAQQPIRGPELEGWLQYSFAAGNIAHPVYYRGDVTMPPVLLLSELAGFAPGLLAMAQRLVEAGYQVHLPWLFGPFGKRTPLRNGLRLCIVREFGRLRAGESAPLTRWLRQLSGHISEHNGGCQLAAIGMCLTGAMVIPLLMDPQLTAAVAAQPAVPISLRGLFGLGNSPRASQLNVSDQDIAAARQRLNTGEAVLWACRFRGDRLSTHEKLARLQTEFPVGLTTTEYAETDWRNSAGDWPHATFTKEYRLAPDDPSHPAQRAWADLLAFLAQHLRHR